MRSPHKLNLDRRLEAYFATLRPSSLREVLKRSAANWQFYAAVTGSAVAMATSASTLMIGGSVPDIAAEPIASILAAQQQFASSKNTPLMNAIRQAIASQESGKGSLNITVAQSSRASVAQVPSIAPGGVVPIFGTVSTIQPGEWISIYGNNLASETAVWNGDFPTTLGGTSVDINGKSAYLMFASPGQINLQAPDDMPGGTVFVVVTTAAGSATSTVSLSQFAPSFSLSEVPSSAMPLGVFGYVCGIIVRSDGSGAYGGGTYDLLGPTGTFWGYSTVAAKAGDTVELFGVGFGPTTPTVPAGQAFTGAAPLDNTLTLYIDNVYVKPTFVGLSSAGLYQINLIVPPGLGEGEVSIQATVGGMQTQSGVFFSLEMPSTGPVNSGTVGPGPGTAGPGPGSFGPGPGSFGPGPSSFGGSPGTGGGSSGGRGAGAHTKKPYAPKLRYPPKGAN